LPAGVDNTTPAGIYWSYQPVRKDQEMNSYTLVTFVQNTPTAPRTRVTPTVKAPSIAAAIVTLVTRLEQQQIAGQVVTFTYPDPA